MEDNVELRFTKDELYERRNDDLWYDVTDKQLDEILKGYESIDKFNQLKEAIQKIINDDNLNLEVACCEGETYTVTEQTKDLLQKLLDGVKS